MSYVFFLYAESRLLRLKHLTFSFAIKCLKQKKRKEFNRMLKVDIRKILMSHFMFHHNSQSIDTGDF